MVPLVQDLQYAEGNTLRNEADAKGRHLPDFYITVFESKCYY